jgi:hypothetical protein
MAVLGSLRRNSFVLIAVIGMALFAFVIAGVFDGNSFPISRSYWKSQW